MWRILPFFILSIVLVVTLGLAQTSGTLVARSQTPIDPMTLTGEFDTSQTSGEFYGKKVASEEVPQSYKNTAVLGASNDIKRIEVDLSTQRLYAFEGDRLIYDFLISSGKWGRTPTGTFRIWSKFKYTRMSGGSKELRTYYNLPNVPFTMFFANSEVPASRGFGIHGTYWHENFGHPMSHGCINMKTEEAELLYNWAGPDTGEKTSMRATTENPGTEVVIYGVAPKE
jgi:lipoprotein-anchoring transpeptidase ErfK/SrfK